MSVQVFEGEILGVSLTSLVCDDGEIYFKAREVATALRYSSPRDAILKHIWGKNRFEWCNIKGVANRDSLVEKTPLPGIQPYSVFLTEPGVYQLIFSSKLPSAEAFQDLGFLRSSSLHQKNGFAYVDRPHRETQQHNPRRHFTLQRQAN